MPSRSLLKALGKALPKKTKKQMLEMQAKKAKARADRVPLSDAEIDAKLAEYERKLNPPKPVKPQKGEPINMENMKKVVGEVIKNKPKKDGVKKYKSGGKIRGVGCAMRGYGKAMKG